MTDAELEAAECELHGHLVYFIEAAKLGMVKIGRSNNVAQQLVTLQAHSPDLLEIAATISCADGELLESSLHGLLAGSRGHGEWFRPTAAVSHVLGLAMRKELDEQGFLDLSVDDLRRALDAADAAKKPQRGASDRSGTVRP